MKNHRRELILLGGLKSIFSLSELRGNLRFKKLELEHYTMSLENKFLA